MRTLNCPRCSEPMTARTVLAGSTAVLIDVCADRCGGIWLDSQDMETGLDVTDDLQQVVVTQSYVPDCRLPAPCPVCSEPMQRYRWNYTSPVTLDHCAAGHGTFHHAVGIIVTDDREGGANLRLVLQVSRGRRR